MNCCFVFAFNSGTQFTSCMKTFPRHDNNETYHSDLSFILQRLKVGYCSYEMYMKKRKKMTCTVYLVTMVILEICT